MHVRVDVGSSSRKLFREDECEWGVTLVVAGPPKAYPLTTSVFSRGLSLTWNVSDSVYGASAVGG